MSKRKNLLEFKSLPLAVTGTRRQILAAALDAYGDLGYEGVTLSEIARRSGLAKSLVLYHYKNLNQILFELARYWGETGRQMTLEALAENLDSSDFGRIACIIKGAFRWARAYPEMAKLMPVLLAASRKDKKTFSEFVESLDVGFLRISGFLESRFRKEPRKVARAALSIHSHLFGAILYMEARGIWDQISDLEAVVLENAKMLMREND